MKIEAKKNERILDIKDLVFGEIYSITTVKTFITTKGPSDKGLSVVGKVISIGLTHFCVEILFSNENASNLRGVKNNKIWFIFNVCEIYKI